MHRDYSDYSGYAAIVVFDDRIEIQSHGLLPQGVTLEQLSGPHRLKLRNQMLRASQSLVKRIVLDLPEGHD